MALEVNQIYELVNNVSAQALGRTDIAVVNAKGLISLGDDVLATDQTTQSWMKELTVRIGKTIISRRMYRAKNGYMLLDDFEYGAAVQKISFHLMKAVEDPSWKLEDGKSIDPYTINNPEIEQKIFITRTPTMWYVSIQRAWLKEAFLSPSAMGSFISAIFGVMQDSIEFSLEQLGNVARTNFMAETTNVVHLVTEYNAIFADVEGFVPVTSALALYDEKFLRFAIARINEIRDQFTDFSVLNNDGTIERHTPYADQRFIINSKFQRQLETQVQYAAFHDQFVKFNGFHTVNYWQSEKDKLAIDVTRASDGTAVKLDNIVAVLHDRDALGMYKKDEETATTPLNAFGLYYNVAFHEKPLYFNDTSENFCMFTLD